MADRKSRKKKKKNINKSSSQKKINKTRQKERNSNSRSDPDTSSKSDQRTNERSSSRTRGRISTCFRTVVSRITRPFGRGPPVDQNESATTTGKNEGHFNDGPPCEPSVPGPKLGMIKQKRSGEMATTQQRDLFAAVQDLLKPKKTTVYSDVPQVNISFCIKFHSNITSVLIEIYNNIPDLHDTGSEKEDWLFQSEKLRKLLTRGSFAGFSRDSAKVFAASSANKKREEDTRRRRRRSKLVLFLAKATNILPKPRSLCSLLQTRKENAQISRNDSVMQTPLQPTLPEVTENTLQRISPKTRTPTRTAKHTFLLCSVKRPMNKGDPYSWTNVKARNKTTLPNQMTRTKGPQSYRNDKMVPLSLSEMITYSVQNKVLRTKTSTMTPKLTVSVTVMHKPLSDSLSHLQNRVYDTSSTITTRTVVDFPHRSMHIPSFKETRPLGLLERGRGTKPGVSVTDAANILTDQLVRSTEFVRIIFNSECKTQTFSLDMNCFLSMLEIMQEEFMIETKMTARDAFKLSSFSAGAVSRRDTHRIDITIELPGSKNLQVSSVPVSLIQRLLQRRSEDSMVPFTDSDRALKTRNFAKAGRAIAVGTGSSLPRCVMTVRGVEEWRRPIVLPNEAIISVAEKFMEMDVDRELLPLYEELKDPSKYVTFTKQTKRRPIPEEAVTTTAVKYLEFNEYRQEKIIYKQLYSSEMGNIKAIINPENTCGIKQDIEMEANNSICSEEQDETYGSETKIKEDKRELNEITREDVDDDDSSSTKYKLFGDAVEMRNPMIRISYYSHETLPTIPEEPENQYKLSQCDPADNTAELNEPDGAWANYSDHGKLPATYEQRDHTAIKDARSKEYQEFNTSIPSHLDQIEIPFKDIADVVFEKDEEGEPLILSSGGFGDIYRARLSDTNEAIIVKTIEDIDCEDILRETRIQTYLMSGQYVPAIKGVIATPGQAEIMILQQFCAGGRTLYDIIDACLAETLTLLDSHWLQLAYKLVLSYENMHKKGVLHNDIKSDNILVELKPYDARPFLIDFGMATFRKGGRLVLPTGISDCDLEEDHLAPEVRHSQPSSPKSDIYSLGKVFQEMAYFCEELSPLSQEMCNDNPADRPTLEELADEIEDIMVEKDL